MHGAHRGPGFSRKMSGLEAIWSGHAPTKFRDRAGRRNKSGLASETNTVLLGVLVRDPTRVQRLLKFGCDAVMVL